MAIKILLTLDGKDQLKGDLNEIGKAFDEFSAKVQAIAPDSSPLAELTNNLHQAKPALEDTTKSTQALHEALQVLHPLLKAAGVSMGDFSGFTRLASNSLVALGVAAAGAVTIGLAKLAEESARIKGQLSDVFAAPGTSGAVQGQQAFNLLTVQAEKFGTTVGGLAPVLQSFQTAMSNVSNSAKGFVALREQDLPFPDPKNVDAAATAVNTFIQILRAGRQTQDEAQKSAKAFFDAFKDGGPITSAAVRQLPTGTINLLKDALGFAGVKAQDFFAALDAGAVSFQKFSALMVQFAPQAQNAFDTKAIKTMGDELEKLFATINRGFQGMTGLTIPAFIVNQIKLFREDLEAIGAAAQFLGQFRLFGGERGLIPSGEQTVTVPIPIPRPSQAEIDQATTDINNQLAKSFQGKPGFIDVSKSLQNLGAAGIQAGQQVAQGAKQAGDAWSQAKEKFDEFGNSLAEQGAGGQAFKGRLNQIPVFVPELAGQGGQQAGKDAGKQWVTAVQSSIEESGPQITQTIVDDFAIGAEAVNATIAENPPDFAPWSATFATETADMLQSFQTMLQQMRDAAQNPIMLNIEATGGAGGNFPLLMAGGGLVRGAGSGTSDSIMAFLSNGEFIMNARAVSAYGSAFMHAINSMMLPRSLPKFAEGGQVATSQAPVTFVIDRQSFNMSASDSTIRALSRFAVNSQLTSSGRKPSWVR